MVVSYSEIGFPGGEIGEPTEIISSEVTQDEN